MSLLSDILKEIPLSAVLREKISALEEENASLKTENAILKDDLRHLHQEMQKLSENANANPPALNLEETMEKILVILAQNDERKTKNTLARALRLTVPRVEYYLHILEEHNYIYGIHIPLGTGEPSPYHLTQQGRAFLIEKNLI
ncbi:MAG: hypothetical protein M3362_01925 [Acidobacteriota bacterium]|nr:hypothetical protein [Acidobacteriota bacterium]